MPSTSATSTGNTVSWPCPDGPRLRVQLELAAGADADLDLLLAHAAGRLEKQREAEPAQLALLLRSLAARLEAVPVRRFAARCRAAAPDRRCHSSSRSASSAETCLCAADCGGGA